MRITKAQAQANRAHIVETASTLFRERGYDGLGVAELMSAAGFTHGGFYKHFDSKAALMAEAATCGFAHTMASSQDVGIKDFVEYYVSRRHRDALGDGCTIAALGSDAARQSEAVRHTFAAGIEGMLALLSKEGNVRGSSDKEELRAKVIGIVAQAVGAVVLSRACPDDSPLADEILKTCRAEILEALAPADHAASAQ